MKNFLLVLLNVVILMSLFVGAIDLRAQGTAFTYQGRLNVGGAPANGTYDLVFTIYDLPAGPGAFANQTNSAVAISNGLFTVTLDFGSSSAFIFTGPERWLEIAVRTNSSGSYSNLVPRQRITATPYAITASNLSGTISAGQLSGAIPLAQLPPTVVTNNQSGVNFTGTFAGNGAGLSNVTAFATNGWRLDGNVGTTAGTHFLGTTDNQALELRVNGARALRLQPASTPNLIAGNSANSIGGPALVIGSTIAGGGFSTSPNFVAQSFCTIAGGLANTNTGYGAFIGAGEHNRASNTVSAVLTGEHNVASGYGAVVVGGGNGGTPTDGINNWAGGTASIVGSGLGNEALGGFSAVLGGVGNQAFGLHSFVGGGDSNMTPTNGQYAAIPGGQNNFATNYAFAAGRRAKANHTGAFVWADSTGSDFASTAANQFLIRAAGGVGIGTANPASSLQVNGGIRARGGPPGPDGNANNGYTFGTPGDDDSGLSSSANGQLEFYSNAAEVMRIASGGSVGIGVSMPQQQLSVGAGLNIDQNNGNSGTVGNALTFGASSGEGIASKRTAGGNQYGLDFYTASINRLSIANSGNITANGNMTIAAPATLSFGAQTRQMINLFSTQYGIGVQSSAAYFRSDHEFMWYRRGSHSDTFGDPGAGGTLLMRLGINGELIVTASVTAPSFVQSSDRNAKENFAPINSRQVLEKVAALPITRWNFKQDRTSEHIGPMAQDFHAAFSLGTDDKHIATVDADGVALAAIQGLNQKVEEWEVSLRAELKRRDAENAELKRELAELKQLVKAVIQQPGGVPK